MKKTVSLLVCTTLYTFICLIYFNKHFTKGLFTSATFKLFYLFRNPTTIINNHYIQSESYTTDSLCVDQNAQIGQANYKNQG